MISVSSEWLVAMQDGTGFFPTASVMLASGVVLALETDDFTLSNNTIDESAGTDSLPIGVAICRAVQLELENTDGRWDAIDFQDAEITLSVNFNVGGSVESFAAGKFIAGKPETCGETVIIPAQDAMSKADVPFVTTLTFPITAFALLQEICTTCGIAFTASNIPSGDFSITTGPGESETMRSVIGYIAGLSGGNARISRLGVLEIVGYDFDVLATERDGETANGIHDFRDYTNLRMEQQDVIVTGVQTTVYDSDGSIRELMVGNDGYVLKIDNPLIVGQEQTALTIIGAAVIGAQFRIFEMDHIAYPLAEIGDNCRILDTKGGYVYSVITDVGFAFNSFTTIRNSAAAPERARATYTPPDLSAIQRASALVKSEKTAREAAVEALAQQLANSGGMYETTETAAGGGTIYYLHDKPTLASSLVVLKLTAEALGISTDGGQTYPAGWDFVTGTTITNTLQAVGINADWINTGALTVTDADGNVLFCADATAKQVQIGSFTVYWDPTEDTGNLRGTGSISTSGSINSTDAVVAASGSYTEDGQTVSPRYRIYHRGDQLLFDDDSNGNAKATIGLNASSAGTIAPLAITLPPCSPADSLVVTGGNAAFDGDISMNGVGIMGLKAVLTSAEDLNDITEQGNYYQPYNAYSTTAHHYPVNYAGHLEVFNVQGVLATGADGIILQRYTAYRSVNAQVPVVYYRTYYTGWSPWMTEANYYGSGETGTGEGICWNVGRLQICTLSVNKTNVAIATAYGSLFIGSYTWTFPKAFASVPVVTCGVFKWGTSASWGNVVGMSATAANLYGMDVVSRPAGTNVLIQATAIGLAI